VRAVEMLTPEQTGQLEALAERAASHLAEWEVPDPEHQGRIEALRAAWRDFLPAFEADSLMQPRGLEQLYQAASDKTLDLQELLVALLLEPFGDLVDGLAECMADPFGAMVLPFADTGAVRDQIESYGQWALAPAYHEKQHCQQFWYVSAAKQEPRLGDRFAEEGAELESPLDIGRRIKALHSDLPQKNQSVASFLETHPEHALALARVAGLARYPYGEIRDNLIGVGCLPIDMLRCKLSFFGASKFDPKSDRWTRITLCQGAPLADELQTRSDDWWLPVYGG
jgi:hypothetical protein